jgi:hypothetical protein
LVRQKERESDEYGLALDRMSSQPIKRERAYYGYPSSPRGYSSRRSKLPEVFSVLKSGAILIIALVLVYLFLSNYNTIATSVSGFTDTISGKPNMEQLKIGPKNISLSACCINGGWQKIQYTVYSGLNDYLASLPREITYSYVAPTAEDFVMRNLNQEEQRQFLLPLVEKIKSMTDNTNDQAEIAVSMVQNIPYDWEGFRTGIITGKYPYEVLYTQTGVCEEKSKLLAFLLRELGFGVVLYDFETEQHMAVGLKCLKNGFRGSDYCFVETAAPTAIGNSNSDYVGVGKLTSYPEVIKVSNGITYNN